MLGPGPGPGATEKTEPATALLEDLAEIGVFPRKNYLFVLRRGQSFEKRVKKALGQRYRDPALSASQAPERLRVTLPPEHQEVMGRRIRAAYATSDHHEARRSLKPYHKLSKSA